MALNRSDLTDLLKQVGAGDQSAFEQLYNATSAKLYGIILRILKRRDLADEILQETYVKVWDYALKFDPEKGSPITWLAAIARNRALDEVRRSKPVSLLDDDVISQIPDTQPLPGDMILQREDNKKLADCLDTLQDDRKTLVISAYLDGLSREELAIQLGHPIGTIKVWLHRSLKQLKDCLGS
jgi:RNA polymerase sigma-70 factor (ECF subfamily)